MNLILTRREKMRRRLDRQFDVIEQLVPVASGFIHYLRGRRLALIRIPFGIALVLGGFLSILPFLGLWMFPAGLLLLAIDLPALQPLTTSAMIRLRRRFSRLRRRLR